MFIASLLVGQRFQILIGFNDDIMAFFRYGQHLFHVVHQTVVLLALFLILERRLRVHIHIVHFHILDAVTIDERLTHAHHRHIGR